MPSTFSPCSLLIHTTLPARFPREAASSARVTPHFFPAHVTLTSEIPPARYGDEPQAWLDGVDFSSLGGFHSRSGSGSQSGLSGGGIDTHKVTTVVRFERVESQDVFYRRCFVRVGFEGVRALAGVARAVGVLGEGVEVDRDPDGGVRFGEGTEKWLSSWRAEFGPHLSLMYGDEPISEETLKEITKVVQQAGVKLSDEETGATEEGGGWDGGVIWLVPTDKPISEWGKPIATRQL
ncbi:2',3'-cyclic-nucleotide 3'-phosphodiesterase [Chaetomidium leptoderma]|uniref:2',3'-cyclic-nucleotide 3'-phosphodiesterase n=1 Tax=Chaetomidium leptoderma TaxID=669021 RepID=A0AAN6VQS9_9PEZI|nr:2',3'-cyclic-nucleotide 3'-phosphodiesterase [Chaetomidium leptoderma]